MTTESKPPNVHELTPAAQTVLMTHCQNLARSKPRQTETILKLARAQLAITKSLEPFEQVRADLLATVPPVPTPNADDETKQAYTKAKSECDTKFAEIYLKEKFTVTFPEPVTTVELQHFQEPPNPTDLAALHPYIVKLD